MGIDNMNKQEYKYKITIDSKGLFLNIIFLIVFGGVTIWLYKENNGVYLFTMAFTALFIFSLLWSVYRLLFSKVLIGESGFTHYISPGKVRSYEYCEIAEAWLSAHGSGNYFNYRTQTGEVNRFLIYAYQSDEVDYLLMKINGDEAADNEYEDNDDEYEY